ncbi:MAG: hypothetical protein Q8Q42_00970 [Nanoarchaeota archaeon]|nr:hypothetical protein [Nanoarchaeota archaeon]
MARMKKTMKKTLQAGGLASLLAFPSCMGLEELAISAAINITTDAVTYKEKPKYTAETPCDYKAPYATKKQ